MATKSDRANLPVRVINKNDPLNSLSNEERVLARQLGLSGEKSVVRRKALPARWKEIVYAVCSRPYTNAQLAAALGVSRRVVQYRLGDPKDELSEAVERARSIMLSIVVDPMYEKLLRDKSEDTFALRQWFAQRLFPDQFNPNVQANQRPAVQVNVQTNVAQLPRAMTPAEYQKLFAESRPVDAKPDEVPASAPRDA